MLTIKPIQMSVFSGVLCLIMNEKCLELASRLVGSNYSRQAGEAMAGLSNKTAVLLEQGKLPQEGWEDREIEMLMAQLSAMDSNNFPSNCGVGEREGRIFSNLVARRNYNLGHGIGRSGDLVEVQPKAAGSSLINKLTNSMLLDIIKISGVTCVKDCFLVPMATGMALTLTMLALKKKRPTAKYVIWSRIDQKSCFKSILTAGFEPAIIELIKMGEELTTDLTAMKDAVTTLGPENILCIFSTTSCFAPRGPDDVPNIGRLCAQYQIPHIVNNAYGLQSSKCMHLINEAARLGGLDVFIQSTDKNLMVPVGGAIIAGFDKELIKEISQTYPGRASGSPSVDVFITLLSMGVSGYKLLLAQRKTLFAVLKSEMQTLADKYGLSVLESKNNTISIAMTLHETGKSATNIGSMLFTRGVSGTRVVTGSDNKSIEDVTFFGWGAHTDNCDKAYLTAAASVGMNEEDVKQFVKRVSKVFDKIRDDKENKEILSKKTSELML